MSLLSNSQISNLTGNFYQHFQTFAISTIIVNKEPIQTITNLSQNVLPGYGNESAETNLTYTSVSGNFPAIVRYPGQTDDIIAKEIKINIPQAECIIKVERICRDFIFNGGKTENIVVNDRTYNLLNDGRLQNFLSLQFFYFGLIETD